MQTSPKQNQLGKLNTTGIRVTSAEEPPRVPPSEVRQPSEASMINRGRYSTQTTATRLGESSNRPAWTEDSEDWIVTRILTGTLCGRNMIRRMAISSELFTLGATPSLTQEEGDRTRDSFKCRRAP